MSSISGGGLRFSCRCQSLMLLLALLASCLLHAAIVFLSQTFDPFDIFLEGGVAALPRPVALRVNVRSGATAENYRTPLKDTSRSDKKTIQGPGFVTGVAADRSAISDQVLVAPEKRTPGPTLTLPRHILDAPPATARLSGRQIAKRLDTWIVDFGVLKALR